MKRSTRSQPIRGTVTRRQFLEWSAVVAGAAAVGPTLLAACGSDSDTSSGTSGAGGSGGGGKTLHVDNWPLYIDDKSVGLFKKQTGIALTHTESINDNNEYFAKIQPVLSQGGVVPADIMVLTGWMAKRLIDLDWAQELPLDQVPNAKNLVDNLVKPPWDSEGTFTLPWQSGVVGIAYNRKAAGRDLTSVNDLFDAKFKGKVGFLLEMNDSLGLVLREDGIDPATVTFEQAKGAFDRIEQAARGGQIRQFTGNDYQDDLVAGNFVCCVGWSGDVVQLALDNPDLNFIIPDEGGMSFTDTMVMPKGAENVDAAAEFMNYFYDPVNAARVAAFVNFDSPVKGVKAELAKSPATKELATSPLMFPSAPLDVVGFNPNLPEEELTKFDERWAEITEG